MLNIREYHRPDNLDEALDLLGRAQPRTAVLAGGTWLIGEGPRHVEAVVDVAGLGLDRIERDVSSITVGAAVSLQGIVEAGAQAATHDPLRVLGQAAHDMAGLNIRNRASLGGAVCTADRSSPLVTALLACGADVIVHAPDAVPRKARTLPLAGFLAYRDKVLQAPALVSHIRMPEPSPDTRACYVRVSRTPRDYPLVCAAAQIAVHDGIGGNVRIALGGAADAPIRLSSMEFELEKKRIADHLDAALVRALDGLRPAADWLGSAEYRLAMARVLVARAVAGCLEPAA